MRKSVAIVIFLCLAVCMTACSQRSENKPESSSVALSESESPSETSMPQSSESSTQESSALPPDTADTVISGKVTLMSEERYLFYGEAEAGTIQDEYDMRELVADMGNVVSYIYVTSMAVSSERDLTQEEVSSIISILQNSPTNIYESLGNPPTGGNYFVLVAYDASDNVYLRISFNGEWAVYELQNNGRTLVFNGENSGLEAIRELIAT